MGNYAHVIAPPDGRIPRAAHAPAVAWAGPVGGLAGYTTEVRDAVLYSVLHGIGKAIAVQLPFGEGATGQVFGGGR